MIFYYLYGTASALVFGPLFFLAPACIDSNVIFFASFGRGFIPDNWAPLIFGGAGDTGGRKHVINHVRRDGRGHVSHRLPALRQYRRAGACFTGYSAFSAGIYGLGEWGHGDGRGICCWGKHQRAVKRAIANRRTHGTVLATGVFIVANYRRRCYRGDVAYSLFCSSALLVLPGLYMRHRLDEAPVFPCV